jgi:cytochrome c-type biogenesis protein CcmF
MVFLLYAAAVFFIISVFLRIRSSVFYAAVFFHAGGVLIAGSSFFLASQCALINTAYVHVARHLSAQTPLAYRLCAFWAGQEGSLLLWVLFLYLGSFVIRRKRTALIIYSVVISLFSLILAVSSNPFTVNTVNVPASAMNPLLENFWFSVHPPLLFAGYAAALVISSIAASSLIHRNRNSILNYYSFIIAGFALLSSGIISGGVWAYSVQGWGGYWNWDPVENLSFIPWLILFIMYHQIPLLRERKTSHYGVTVYALLLAMSVISATGLTRCGLLLDSSVHSFASSSGGYAFLLIAGIFAFASVFLLIKYRATEKIRDLAGAGDRSQYLITVTTAVFALPVFLLTAAPVIAQAAGPGFSVNRDIFDTLSAAFGFILLSVFIYNLSPGISKKIIVLTGIAGVPLSGLLMIAEDLSYTSFAVLIMVLIYSFLLLIKSLTVKKFDRLSVVHSGITVMIAGIAFNDNWFVWIIWVGSGLLIAGLGTIAVITFSKHDVT